MVMCLEILINVLSIPRIYLSWLKYNLFDRVGIQVKSYVSTFSCHDVHSLPSLNSQMADQTYVVTFKMLRIPLIFAICVF